MKQLAWLIGLLAATPALYVACGGDEATTTATGTTGGAGGAGATGGAGGATTGATGGATGGTGGSAGSTGGSAGKAGGGMMDAGAMCGTMTCSTNPTGNNICDTMSMPNRCVDCLSNVDCEVEMVNKVCDTRPATTGMMLPAYQCVQCVDNTHCPMGTTCNTQEQCVMSCGTANCTITETGNNICDLPNNRCVDCMTDADCAVETTDKFCDTTTLNMAGLPVFSCEACLVDAHCAAGQSCVNNACITVCGTANCSTNPTGNDKCDLPNNRCVDCLNDADCAVEMGSPHCDTSLNPAGLPRYACEECVTAAHCPAGQVCVDNNCEASCTTDANCSADGGGGAPYCNPTTMSCAECATDAHCSGNNPACSPIGECEECTTDTHCAAQTMTPFCSPGYECVECMNDGHCATQVNQPICNPSNNNCVQCITSDQCTPPATCGRGGNCTGGGGMDAGGTSPDAGGGGG